MHADGRLLHPNAHHQALQRGLVNQMALGGQGGPPELLTTRDVLRFAILQGANDLRLAHKTGSLTPGKHPDIVILDATAINVAPLNHRRQAA